MGFKALNILLLLWFTQKEGFGEEEKLYLIKSIRTDYLQHYEGYAYISLIHFSIPSDTQFASFRFQAEQTSFSIFGCDVDEIILYMKHGSIPIVNPDNSKMLPNFYNASHTKMMYLEFSSDKKYHYINITTPPPGTYYATAFHPYLNPDDAAITQSGLSRECQTYVDASLFIQKSYAVGVGMSGVEIDITLAENETQTYKFFIPGGNDRLVIVLSEINFCESCIEMTANLYSDSRESTNQGLISISRNTYKNNSIYYRLPTIEQCWQYIQFNFTSVKNITENQLKLKLRIKSFSASNKEVIRDVRVASQNLSNINHRSVYKILREDISASEALYKEYELVRSGRSESFFYQFDLHPKDDGSVSIAVNLTNSDYTTFKFHLNEAIDIGGTINVIIAFAPRITKSDRSFHRTPEPTNNRVVACIRNSLVQIPTYPDKCVDDNSEFTAPLVLSNEVTNTTAVLPYPEAGTWYVTLKLFCGECTKCDCPKKCIDSYQQCIGDCEKDCDINSCGNCTTGCRAKHLENSECSKDCDCDGACKKDGNSCDTSVLFDITSYPCVSGSCGANGRCVFMVTEGMAYSTCLCSNKYKGWDCSDDSNATPYGLLVLEILLLTLSNLGFLPAVYFAYVREYYVESIVYFSTFFFSTFYHACDAGENVISFCIVRLGVLQFSDFFSGLLSIWVTLIAMAYLPQPFVAISHMLGCIVLAFGTTFNKTSLWVFMVPCVIGLGIMIGHWIYLGKKNKCLFPSKKYLTIFFPIGMVVVFIGLITFGLFQTQSNYKYLHSLWHFLMAVGVIILLPIRNVFLPDTMHTNMNNVNGINAHYE